MVTNLKKIFLIVSVFFVISCVEEAPRIVPDVYVDFSINVELPQYISLKTGGVAVVVPNYGYNNHGVIIYNNFEGYLAFDATCPQHIENPTAVTLDDLGAGGTATCPECNAVYTFFSNGESTVGYPLKRYVVTKSGSFLYVKNQ